MKKIFSLILSLAMLLTITSGLNLTAYADSSQYGNIYYEENENGTIEITGCTSSATSINIPSTIVGKTVTSIRNCAFYGCKSLTSVTIPNSVTSIGDEVFYRCSSLKNITIPDSVTSIGDHAFFECKLVTLTMGNGVNYIDSCAFLNCEQLYEVNYNGTVAQWKAISVDSNNSNLTKAIIKCTDGILGNGNEVIIDNVVYNIYNDYTAQINKYPGNPEILTIPESVSYEGYSFKINSIGDYAFLECTNLKSLTMPSSVTKIGQYAFYCCTYLKDVYYLSTISDWNKIEITNTNDVLKKATIHCIDGTINVKVPTTQPQPRPQPSPTPTPTQPQPQPTTTTTTTAAKAVAKPKSAKFKKVKSAKKAVSVEWKKVSGVKGYQVQVATDKKFKKNKKTATVKKQKTTKVTIKKLKAKKKYYVRIRTYKTVNGKKVYSSWSKVKTVKTK